LPAGITGLARPREWDATVAIDLPELSGVPADELSFIAFPEEVVARGGLFGEACGRVADALDREVSRPYMAQAIRRGANAWAAGARRVNAELMRLPGIGAESLEVAISPDGEMSAAVDGAAVQGLVAPEIDAALRELERRGRDRFEAFAARADNLDGERWQLTIDPL
jgi:hypothetical protein